MTTDERARAVAEFGFTPRQARFLTLVMRHAGVCVPRQYSSFAGIVHGEKTCAFFRKLVTRRCASAFACRHNRGHVYHIHHHGLYDAIGERNSAHRRPISAGRIVERLMLLDAVLADHEINWLATRAEKAAHFATVRRCVAVEREPHQSGNTASAEPGDPPADKLPIGVDTTGRSVFLYLVRPSARDDFRWFLQRHADLFQRLLSWSLRIVFPRLLADAYAGLQAVVHDELESPLDPRTLEELKWYFAELKARRKARIRPGDERFKRAANGFDKPRFRRLYERWLKDGDNVLDGLSSAVTNDPLASGTGRIECLVLAHRYEHLSPLVDIESTAGRPEQAEQLGEQASTRFRRPMYVATPQGVDGAARSSGAGTGPRLKDPGRVSLCG
jgi:hypothetical protein